MTTITTQISDLKKIIAAPLVATVQADVYAAIAFVKFIEKYGFEKNSTITKTLIEKGFDAVADNSNGTSQLGKLKMVTFYYDYEVIEDGKPVVRIVRVTIPFLSLVPLPLLQVNDAEYRFDIRITGIYDSSVGIPPPPDGEAPSILNASVNPDDAQLPKVLATYTPYTSENNTTLITFQILPNYLNLFFSTNT